MSCVCVRNSWMAVVKLAFMVRVPWYNGLKRKFLKHVDGSRRREVLVRDRQQRHDGHVRPERPLAEGDALEAAVPAEVEALVRAHPGRLFVTPVVDVGPATKLVPMLEHLEAAEADGAARGAD